MKQFFSLSILCLSSLGLVAQDQLDFELEVKKIDSLIENRIFKEAESSLIALKESLVNTSLLTQDTVTLYLSSNLALVSYRLDNCENTIKYSKEDRTLKAEIYGEGDLITLAASRNLGVYYINCDSVGKAKEILQETISLHDRHIGQPDEIYVRTLDDLAFSFGKLDDVDNAKKSYVKLLSILGDSKNNFYYHVIENYSALLMSTENYEDAAVYYDDLKKHTANKPDFPILLKDYYNVFVHIKDYVRALDASSLIISSCENNQTCDSQNIDSKEFTLNAARLSMLLSRFENATEFYLDAEESYRNEPSKYVSILQEQADLYQQLRNQELQLEKLNTAIDFQRKNGWIDSLSYTRAVTNLGKLYTETGKFKQADELFTTYIEELESKGVNVDSEQLASAYHSLGKQRYYVQNFKDADFYLGKARDVLISNDLKQSNEYASVLNSLGALYEGFANYRRAENRYREALAIASEGSSGLRISLASNLANILINTDSGNDSINILLNQAIDWQMDLTGTNHPTYANLLGNRGVYYLKNEEYPEAEKDLNQAISIFEYTVSEDHPQYLSALTNRGLLYEQTDRVEEGLQTMVKAKGIYEKYYSRSHPGFILTMNNLSNLYTILERYDEAEPLFMELAITQVKEIRDSFDYLSESEKKHFVEEKRKLLNNFKGYIVARTVKDEGSIKPEVLTKWYDLELSTKGMLLNATKKTRDRIFNSQDAELIQLFSDWTAARKQIADLHSLQNKNKNKDQTTLDLLSSKINTLEKEISRRSSEFSSVFSHTAPTFSQISSSLSSNEASVEIIRTQIGDDAFYVALIGISGSASPDIFVIGKGDHLEKTAFKAYKNKITYKIEDTDAFEAYWRKIHDHLTPKGITKIYYAPDGVYHKISLVTLYDSDTKEYLLDDLEIVQVTSTKDLIDIKQTTQTPGEKLDQVLLVGRPSYSLGANPQTSNVALTRGTGMSSIADLPGTETEIMEIQKVLEQNDVTCQILLREDAGEKEVKENMNSKLVHIATHGFFNDKSDGSGKFVDPMMNSGLLFAGVSNVSSESEEDGILTAYEIMNLDLSNVNMIVLSACETALGEISTGEGIYGLQRAFFVGGAETLIMSLWKVDDQATKDLMTIFYKEYIKKGDKRAAFITAQRKIKKKYKSPIYWGAFVMLEG